jgi:hypothetical protein
VREIVKPSPLLDATLPFLPIAKVEAVVLDNYATVLLKGRLRQRITTLVKDQLARKATLRLRAHLTDHHGLR